MSSYTTITKLLSDQSELSALPVWCPESITAILRMFRHTHPWKRQGWSVWWRWGYFPVTINSAWEAILYKKPSTETGKTDSYHSMWVLIFPNSSLSAYFWKFVKIFVKIFNQIEGQFLKEQYIWHSFTRQMFMPVAMLFHIYSIQLFAQRCFWH